MSANWINAHVTAADYTFPSWYGDLGPGDIVADEVTRRLRETNAPWGGANKLLAWFNHADRIQRVHFLDRGDFRILPVLLLALSFKAHDEVPGSLDVNSIRVDVAVVCEKATLHGVIPNGQASIETIFAYVKRLMGYRRNRQLTVTINSNDIGVAKQRGVQFGSISLIPDFRPPGVGEASDLAAFLMPVEYGAGVDMESGQIDTVRSVDPNA